MRKEVYICIHLTNIPLAGVVSIVINKKVWAQFMIHHLSEQTNWWWIITCSLLLLVCTLWSRFCYSGWHLYPYGSHLWSSRCLSLSMSVPLSHVLKIRHTVHSWMCKWILPLMKFTLTQMRPFSEALCSQSNVCHKGNWGYIFATFNIYH